MNAPLGWDPVRLPAAEDDTMRFVGRGGTGVHSIGVGRFGGGGGSGVGGGAGDGEAAVGADGRFSRGRDYGRDRVPDFASSVGTVGTGGSGSPSYPNSSSTYARRHRFGGGTSEDPEEVEEEQAGEACFEVRFLWPFVAVFCFFGWRVWEKVGHLVGDGSGEERAPLGEGTTCRAR